MAKHRGKAESGRQRYSCAGKNGCGRSTTGSKDTPEHETFGYDTERAEKYHMILEEKIKSGELKKIVVTCAQNNTRKNAPFFKSLLRYCEHNKAALVVVPMHYKNVTAYTGNDQYQKVWDRDLENYLIDKPLKIGGVIIQAGIKISATMVSPLSGKESIGGLNWTIFGHPKFAMETIADIKTPKRMYTSGSITVKNYSRTNAGAKAEFHHIDGALIIEGPFIRQLNADSKGNFYDLDKHYTPDKIEKNKKILGIVTGDDHVKFYNRSVRKATFDNPDSIISTLKPKYIVRHDVVDNYAGSHWHEKDDVLKFHKHHKGHDDLRKELQQAIDFINDTTPQGATNLIVQSNHHEQIYKFLATVDPKKDPVNALLIHELKQLQYKEALKVNVFNYDIADPVKLYMRPRLTCKTKFLKYSESFTLKGIELSLHGHIGPNGSRGTPKGLSKSTRKMMTGHGHGGCIINGLYQVGTGAGHMPYQRGLSAQMNTHGIIYPNGKRTLIDIIKGEWRLI